MSLATLNRDCILLVVEVLVILSRLAVIQTYVNYLRKVPVHVLNNSLFYFILGLPYACLLSTFKINHHRMFIVVSYLFKIYLKLHGNYYIVNF